MPGVNKYNNSQKAFYQQNGRVDRILGDKKRVDTFVDSVELKWNYTWSNEFKAIWQTMTHAMYDDPESEKTISEIDGVITTKTNLIENKYYDIGDEATEHEFILFKCPKNGIVPISTKLKGIDLIFQPGLDIEFKAGWSDFFKTEIDVTPTYVMDTKTGLYLVERPIQYVNSYAIFNNQNKANRIINLHSGLDVNYYNGKLGHLHAYCCYLPDGKKVWLESYLENGIIYVKLPDYILNDESIWKVGLRIGPTFGYTTAPATKTSVGDGDTTVFKATLSEAGTATSITQYLDKGTGTPCYAKMGIYADSSDYPGALIVSSAQIELTTDDSWSTASIADTSLSAADYWIACLDVFGNIGLNYFYDANAAYKTYNDNASNTDLPANYAASQTLLQRVCGFYVTYNQASTFLPKSLFIN